MSTTRSTTLDHRDGIFYIRTNDPGKNFRVVTAPSAAPGREHWTELIPLDADNPLEDFDLFAAFAVATRRKLGLPTLESHRRFEAADSEQPHFCRPPVEHRLPEPTYTAPPHVNRIFDDRRLPVQLPVAVSPASVYEYNVARADFDVPIGHSQLLKQQEVPGGFDPGALCLRTHLGRGARQDGPPSLNCRPGLHRLPPRPLPPGWKQPALRLWLRLLWISATAWLLARTRSRCWTAES